MKKFLILLLMMMMVGCGSNDTRLVASAESFSTTFTNGGFTVSDNLATYEENDYITAAMIAKLGEDVTVELVTYDTEKNAKKVQDSQIESFELLKSTGASVIRDKGSNYYDYSIVSNGYYMVSSRVDNTLVFCKTLLENKDTVETLINNLGY